MTGVLSGSTVFTDPAGQTLTYSVTPSSTGGATVNVDAQTGVYTYTPTLTQRRSATASTLDQFTVTASNGVASASKTVTVSGYWLAGTPTAGTPAWTQNNPGTGVLAGSANFTDPLGRSLSYSVTPSSTGGATVTVDPRTGTYTYTPTLTQRRSATPSTVDQFTVTASNGVTSASRTISVSANWLAGTPTVGVPVWTQNDAATGARTGSAGFTDLVGRSLSYTVTPTSTGGATVSVDPQTGLYTYTPTAAQRQNATASTVDQFTVTASNGVTSASRTISVSGGWLAGTPTPGTQVWTQNNPFTGVLAGTSAFTDPAGRALTYSVTPSSTGGATVSIDPQTGIYTYTPTQDQRLSATAATRDQFTVTASNGVNSVTRTIGVSGFWLAGTPVAGNQTWSQNNPYTGFLAGNAAFVDPVGRTLTYTVTPSSTGGAAVSIDPQTGVYTYTPTLDQRRSATASTMDQFTVTASNGVSSTSKTVGVSGFWLAGSPIAGNQAWTQTNAATGVLSGTSAFVDAVGRTLSYTVTPSSTGGATVSIDPQTGIYTYTPTLDQRRNATTSTLDQFIVTASNGVSSTAKTVAVSGYWLAGTPTAGTQTWTQSNPNTGFLAGNAAFTDLVGRPLTYTVTPSSTGGATVSVDPQTGTYTYTPTLAQRRNATTATMDQFTVTASNGVNSFSRTIGVSGYWLAGTPTAGAASPGSPASDTGAIRGSVAVNDVVGRTLTYSVSPTSTGGGVVTVDAATGVFTYTPAPGQRRSATRATTDTFTLTASNGVNSVTKVVTVGVDPGTPVVGPGTPGRPAVDTGAVNGNAGFTDTAGRALAYSVTPTSTGGGAVSIDPTTGAYTYTPSAGQRRSATSSTTDTFTITATNGVRTTTQTITVAVDPGTPVAEAPAVGTPDTATGVLNGRVVFSDTAGRTLRLSTPATTAAGATVTFNDATGAFVYTPTAEQRRTATAGTTDTFVVTADNGVRTTTQTIAVAVDPGTPVAGGQQIDGTDSVSGVVSGSLAFSDTAGRGLVYRGTGRTANGGIVTVDAATGAFVYTPSAGQRRDAVLGTTDSFVITADNGARTASQTVIVAVDPGTPVAGPRSGVAVDVVSGRVDGTVPFSDTAGRTLTYSASSSSTGGGSVTIDARTGAFSYTPSQGQRQAADGSTTDSFSVTVSNGVRTETQVVTVAVDPGAPIAYSPTVGRPETRNGRVAGTAQLTDTAGRALTYSVAGTSTGGGTVSINAATGEFVYTPTQQQRQAADGTATDSFVVTASNGVRTEAQTITVAVDPGVPVLSNQAVGTPDINSGGVTGTVSFADTAGRSVSYRTTGASANGGRVTVDPATGDFVYTPGGGQRRTAGLGTTDTFVIVADNGVVTTAQTVTVSVDPGTPVAGVDSQDPVDRVNGRVNGAVAFSDTAGRTLTYSTSGSTAGGGSVTIDAHTGAYQYTPTQDQRLASDGTTTDTFTVTVTNGVRSDTQTVTVAVDPGLVIADSSTSHGPDSVTGRVNGRAAFYDTAGRTLTFSTSGTSAGGGTVSVDELTGAFVYTPTADQRRNAGAREVDTFVVTASNGVRRETQTITVDVDPGTPVLNGEAIRGVDSGSGAVDGSVSFTDTAGRTLTYTGSGVTANGGTVTVDPATGGFVYTPTVGLRRAAGIGATDSFVITVSNGVRQTTKTVIVGVDPGTPVAGVGSQDTVDRTTGRVNGAVAFSDTAGRTLVYTTGSVTDGGGSVTIDPSTGAYQYTPSQSQRQAAGADTTDTFTVTVSNGARSETQLVTVAVDPGDVVVQGGSVGRPNVNSGAVNGRAGFSDTAGRALSYSASGATTGGGSVTVDAATGAFVYTPTQAQRQAADRSTTDTFVVTAGNGVRTQTQTITVTVDPGTPIAAGQNVSDPDFGSGVVTGTVVFTDTAGRSIVYRASGRTEGGATVTVDPSTGAFTYTPSVSQRQAAGAGTTETVVITADNGAVTATQTVRVVVDPGTPVAGPRPQAALDRVTGKVTGGLAVTDTAGRALSYSTPAATAGGGSVSIDARTGAYTYTPSAAQRRAAADALLAGVGAPTDTFTITVSNGFRSITQTVVATVDAGYTVQTPGGLGDVNGAVADRPAEVLNYEISDLPGSGIAKMLEDGTFVYVPSVEARRSANLTGPGVDRFTVRVTGVTGDVSTIEVAVPVTPSNVAPGGTVTVGAPDAATGVVSGRVVGVDPDGDPLTYGGSGTTSHGNVVVNASTGVFIYTPTGVARHNAAADGATADDRVDNFNLTVSDAYGATVTVPVTVAVVPSNAAPTSSVVVSGTDATSGAVSGTVVGVDADRDALTYRVTGLPAGGTVSIDPRTGAFVYTPSATARHALADQPNYTSGFQTITLTDPTAVSMGTFTTAATAGLYAVRQLNQPGTAVRNYIATYFTAAETGTYYFGQTGSPVDTVMVAYSGTFDPTAPGTGALVLNDDTSPMRHAAVGAVVSSGGCGTTNFCPQVSTDLTAGQTVTLMITTYAPDRPLGLPETFYANRSGEFSTSAPPSNADAFTVEVSDGHGGRSTVRVPVTITPSNAVPTATTTAGAPDVTGVVAGAVLGADADGDRLTYSGPSGTARGSVVVNADGSFTYTPSAAARHAATADGATDADRTDTFTVNIADGYGGTVAVPVTVTISGANAGPTGTATTGTPDASTGAIAGAITATDADGDRLTYTAPGGTGRGSILMNADGTFSYTPTATARHNAAADGATEADLTDGFTVTVSDGHGGTYAVPVSLTITGANVAPTGTATVGAPNASTAAVAGAIVGRDADGDRLTYSGPASTDRGSIALNADGTFTYTPTATARHTAAADGATDADRVDSFTVTITDGYGGQADVPVTVSILSANASPTGTATVGSADANGAVAVTLNASDADADVLTSRVLSGPANGTVSYNAQTGQYTYTPNISAQSALYDFNNSAVGTGLQYITLSDPTKVTQGTFTSNAGGLYSVSQLNQPGPYTRNYVATYFTATETRTYTFGQTDAPVDTVMVLYSGGFDPANPGRNAIVLNDDWYTHDNVGATVSARGCGTTSFCPQVSANLTAGQTVELVVTTYSSNVPLGLPQTFYSNGAGRLTSSAPPSSTDSFTIQISDGHGGIRNVNVSVPIRAQAAPPVAGTPTVNSPTVATRTYNSSFVAAGPWNTTTVFTNTTVDQIVGISGNLAGAWVGGAGTPYYFTNTGSSATVQLQVPDALYVKTVKVTLTQSGSDVVALVDYARYADAGYTGSNFDTLGASVNAPIATSGGAAGYGVSSLSITTSVVTGSAAFTDPAGRRLTYSTSGTSTGGGRVIVDPATGAFTYIPTPSQRQSATSSTTDSFTITASNGSSTATQVITVPVA